MGTPQPPGHQRPPQLPQLPRGDGSLGWDPERGQVTLRHRYGGKAHIERGGTVNEVIAKRERRRSTMDKRADLLGESTLGSMLDGWISFKSQGRSTNTITSYRWSAKHITAQLGEGTDIHNVTVTDVEEMFTALVRDHQFSRGSMDKFRTHWGSLLRFAARRKLMVLSHMEELRLAARPAIAPRDAGPVWYRLEDYREVRGYLLGQPTSRNVLYAAMMLCGLRPGEAMGLKWQYVDLEGSTLRVEGSVKRGRGQDGVYTTTLKTDHLHRFAHRTVPIPKDLHSVLKEMRQRATIDFVFEDDQPSWRNKQPYVTPDICDEHAKTICRELRLPYINPVGYRHTFASVCRHNHMPYEILAKLMGHANTTELHRTYGHPMTDLQAPDMDRYLDGAA